MDNCTRRRVIIVTTVLACLIATDRWLGRMEPELRQYEDDPYKRVIANLTKIPMPDIVVLGSSRAGCGLAPDEFNAVTGKTAFNAAVNASGVVEWHLLAKRLFTTGRPRLVVLGINAQALRADYQPTRAARYLFEFHDLLEHLRKDRVSIASAGNYVQHRLGSSWVLFDRRFETRMWFQERLTPILPKHAQLARKLRERVTRPSRSDGEFSYQAEWAAQLPTLEERMAVDPTPNPSYLPPPYSPDADAVVRLGLLMDWLQERQIAVMLVYIPNSPLTEERWRNIEPVMTDAIARVCREHGAPFLTYDPADVPRTNADYIDEFHVGVDLARRISRRAAYFAESLGLLDDDAPRFAGTGETDVITP